MHFYVQICETLQHLISSKDEHDREKDVRISHLITFSFKLFSLRHDTYTYWVSLYLLIARYDIDMFYRISQIFGYFKSSAKTREEKKTPFVRIYNIWLTIILQQRSNMCASRNINLIRRLILNLKPITFNNKNEETGDAEKRNWFKKNNTITF